MHTLRKKGNTLYRVGVIVFVFLTLLGFAGSAFAKIDAKYTPLVGIPGITNNESTTLPDYINAIYIVLITIGALWGVIKIVFAGVKYSLSDIVTDKSDAKDDIKGVLLGLVLLLLPWVILNEIYPNLTNLNILQPGTNRNPALEQAHNATVDDWRNGDVGDRVRSCPPRSTVRSCEAICTDGKVEEQARSGTTELVCVKN